MTRFSVVPSPEPIPAPVPVPAAVPGPVPVPVLAADPAPESVQVPPRNQFEKKTLQPGFAMKEPGVICEGELCDHGIGKEERPASTHCHDTHNRVEQLIWSG